MIQTNHIDAILPYLSPSSWLILDLDDTLLEGENQLGRKKWYDYEVDKLLLQGHSKETIEKKLYSQWILSQTICPIRTPEPNTASVLAKAKESAQLVLGLTDRKLSIASLTIEQLHKLQIDLSHEKLPFHLKDTLYRNGVWFLSDTISKADALVYSLNIVGQDTPKRIIVVDDEKKHLEEILHALKPFNIEFIGIHYVKTDERPFNPMIADLEYQNLPNIISDHKAEELLQSPFQ